MDIATSATAIVAALIAIGEGFYIFGVMRTEMKQLRTDIDKHDGRLGNHDKDLRDGAVKFEGITKTLEAIDERTERMERMLEKAVDGKPH